MTDRGRRPGLQQERTELAWRRTLLAIAVGAVVVMRVLSDTIGVWAAVVGLAGIVGVAVLWVVAGRRHRGTAGDRSPAIRTGGGLLAATAALSVVGAVLGLAYLATGIA